MKVLICVASKHGATDGIGRAIADRLRSEHIEVDVIPPVAEPRLELYDAVVIGSAVYMGRWLGPGRDFVTTNSEPLSKVPVWLFSSGPITDKADPADSADGDQLLATIHGREHRLFGGRLNKDGLGWTERAIVRMVNSPWGDYRPWDEIEAWAESIARELTAVPA
jgi:menaquinone-dependent protoporphyrinogen oxidase